MRQSISRRTRQTRLVAATHSMTITLVMACTGFKNQVMIASITAGPPKPANPRIRPAKKATSMVSSETEKSVIEFLNYNGSDSNSAAPFSAIAITAALVLPEITDGMIEASTTNRLSTPRTLSFSSTTDAESVPIRQVEVG